MDPATLYILFALSDGTQKAMERRFVSVQDCEGYVEEVIRPRSDKSSIVRHECVSDLTMQGAPKWYPRPIPQKLIHGVPLDPKHWR